MRVPLFDMAAEISAIRGQLDAAIARVVDRGVFIGGAEVEAFEAELAAAATTTAPLCAVGVTSGTDALLAILMALGVGAGDEVVTTPLTFFATAAAAARLGARVVFADVDDETLNLAPRAAANACSAATRSIVTVHLFGYPASVPTRAQLGAGADGDGDVGGDGAKIAIVEDAAHSVLSVPLTGDAAALSFFPTKNLGALGDAGAVLTHRADLADRVRLLRTHGASPKYHHVAVGGNFRLDALQAAVLRAKLPHLPAWTSARRAHAARYRACFAAASAAIPPELRLPLDHASHAYHQFCIRAPRRDELRAFLAAAGIGTEIYYPEPLHLQPCWREGVHVSHAYRPGSLPVAERACRELLALPIHPTLAAGSEEYVVEKIAAYYRR